MKNTFNFKKFSYLENNSAAFCIVASVLTLLFTCYQVFSRKPVFYDEIINSYKASVWHIFDYALRPIFYLFNSISWDILGGGYYSLILQQIIIFLILSVLISLFIFKLGGWFFGLYALILYVIPGKNLELAITAMPHLLAGLFNLCCVLLSILLFSRIFKYKYSELICFLLLHLVAFIGLLVHPLNLVNLAASLFLIFIYLLLKKYLYSEIRQNWKLPFLSVLVTVIYYLILHFVYSSKLGKSYLAHWIEGINKVNNPELVLKYSKPFWYYFTNIWDWLSILSILGLIIVVIIAYKRFSMRSLTANSKGYKLYISFSITSFFLFANLFFISAAHWKFERVIVGIFPIAILWICISLLIIYSLLPKMTYKVAFNTVLIILISTLVLPNSRALQHTNNEARSSSMARLSEVIRALPDKNIFFLGLRAGLWRGQVQIGSSEKTITSLDVFDREKLPADVCELFQRFYRTSNNSILVHRSLPNNELLKFNQLPLTGKAYLIFSDQSEYKLWGLQAWNIESKIWRLLLGLPTGTTVGISGFSVKHPIYREINRLGLKTVNISLISNKVPSSDYLIVAERKKTKLIENLGTNYSELITNDSPLNCKSMSVSLWSLVR